jgi:hypothetical protein
MTNTIYKSISYAYPTSSMANELGFNDTGCFYVQCTAINEAAQAYSYTPIGSEGFLQADDKDLISYFHEVDGKVSSMFMRYGNQKAINAIMEYAA